MTTPQVQRYYEYLSWYCGHAQALLASDEGRQGREFLAARGIPPDLALANGIGFAPASHWIALLAAARGIYTYDFEHLPEPVLRDLRLARAQHLLGPRLTIPYTDASGRVLSICGRLCKIRKHERRHLPGSHGIFNVAALSQPEVFLCEDPFDVLSLLACGYPAAAIPARDALRWAWLPRGPQRLVFCSDRVWWQSLAREAELRGKEVYFLDPAALGGELNDRLVRTGSISVMLPLKKTGEDVGEDVASPASPPVTSQLPNVGDRVTFTRLDGGEVVHAVVARCSREEDGKTVLVAGMGADRWTFYLHENGQWTSRGGPAYAMSR